MELVTEKTQTLAQYNQDLETGDAEIDGDEFTTVAGLKAETSIWE